MTTRKSKIKHRSFLILAVCFAMVLSVQSHSLASYAEKIHSVIIDIPVKYIASGGDHSAGSCEYRLKPVTAGAPMPEGTVNGIKTITMEKTGTTSFGRIKFTRPDVYEYTVTRTSIHKDEAKGNKTGKNKSERYISGISKSEEDQAIYHVKAIALNSGAGSLIITKEGEKGKTEILFADTVSAKTDSGDKADKENADGKSSTDKGLKKIGGFLKHGNKVQTGDLFDPRIPGMMMAIALAVLLFLAARKRNGKEELRITEDKRRLLYGKGNDKDRKSRMSAS